MGGEAWGGASPPTRRGPLDWLLVVGASAVFVAFAAVARVPALALDWGWAAALILALVGFLAAGGLAVWRTTRFGGACRSHGKPALPNSALPRSSWRFATIAASGRRRTQRNRAGNSAQRR